MNQYTRTVFRPLLPAVLLLLLSVAPLFSCMPDRSAPDTDTVAITDALSRTVRVKKNPVRVAALLGSFADIWQLSGGTLCASVDDAWSELGLDMGDAVNLGGVHSPSLERLLAAAPDFVLASSSTAAHVEMKDTLEAAGIAVAYFDVDHFTDYLEMLEICTDLTGRKDRYEQYGLQIRDRIDAVRKQYTDAAIPDAQRTVLLLRASSSSVKARGSEGTVLGEMLHDMGCVNIADSDGSLLDNLSVESVIRQEPYHIFVVTMGSDTEAAKASLDRLIRENPAWGTLEAIRENRLHIMDKTLFNLKPNARWAEAYEKLYEALTQD